MANLSNGHTIHGPPGPPKRKPIVHFSCSLISFAWMWKLCFPISFIRHCFYKPELKCEGYNAMVTKKLKTELWPFFTILRHIPFMLRKIVPNYLKSRSSYFLSHHMDLVIWSTTTAHGSYKVGKWWCWLGCLRITISSGITCLFVFVLSSPHLNVLLWKVKFSVSSLKVTGDNPFYLYSQCLLFVYE